MDCAADSFGVSSIQSALDWQNQLRYDREDLRTTFSSDECNKFTFSEEIFNSFTSKESARIFCLSESIEKDRKIMMIIQFGDIDLPLDLVSHSSMFDCDWKISSLVELFELGWSWFSHFECASRRRFRRSCFSRRLWILVYLVASFNGLRTGDLLGLVEAVTFLAGTFGDPVGVMVFFAVVSVFFGDPSMARAKTISGRTKNRIILKL